MGSGRIGMLRKVVSRTPIPSVVKRTQSGLRIVLYHHIGEDCSYTRQIGVSTTPEMFEAHVRRLVKEYDLVTLEDVRSGVLPRRPLLVTFDDAYRSVLDVAAPIMADHGIQPVFFVSTGPIFDGEALLDNLLSFAETESPEVLADVLGVPQGTSSNHVLRGIVPDWSSQRRQALRDRLATALGASAREWGTRSGLYLTPEDLKVLVDRFNFTLGCHTRTHVHVRGLEASEFEDELTKPMHQLEELTGKRIGAFSFPFGSLDDGTPAALEHLHASGFEQVFYVHGRSNSVHANRSLYRNSVGALGEREIVSEIEFLSFCRSVFAGFRGDHPHQIDETVSQEADS